MNIVASGLIRRGAKFGLLYAALLGLAMSVVIFVGSVIGDCEPGPGCHDNDAAIIGLGILSAVPVVAIFSLLLCASAGSVRHFLDARMGARATTWLLSGLTAAAAWASFDLAMTLHIWLEK
ncbi:hypothetical protein A6768_11985 [Sphingobium yanoikuyae]|uniref:Transmembrane protein n=2 Tax=Sphingobium yanoikuyae TaxID=13690 RepID=A0A291MZW4_SPHYA|nr:hypothetical protein A6768_11985 [Sphingobium yanoikuyae]